MQRELTQWVDALEFDNKFGEDGPDELGRKVTWLRSMGRADEIEWWTEVGAKLVRLCEIRAEAPQ